MKSREPRGKAPARAKQAKAAAPLLSTSQARAHFAEALETAQVENAVIGFDRYGRTVAALVPVEAIYMLAGMGKMIDRETRKDIEKGALAFAHSVPYRSGGKAPIKAAAAAKSKTPRTRRTRQTKPALVKTSSIKKGAGPSKGADGRKPGGG